MSSQTISTQELLEALQKQAEGLYYVSETDAPFEVVHYPAGQEPEQIARQVAVAAGMPAAQELVTEELAHFFRNMTNAAADLPAEAQQEARRFEELQAFLEQHLAQVKVYRAGARKITALILGKASTGEVVGLKTQLVET
ncbi:nuclease A inhibitor family protein [Pontibacter liquoris]|uniref:nuclease A inhibitor family protein n=1 Tax=Pontibacter liquoris TaxID=2905677 RepID=UPI001FA6E878|nr:nuclease A inhibitor family protein [Pontibacter liquoris]